MYRYAKDLSSNEIEITEDFLASIRRAKAECIDGTNIDCSKAYLECRNIERDIDLLLSRGFTPNMLITTFPLARQIQQVFMEIVKPRSYGCFGLLYNLISFDIPVSFDMAIIPHPNVGKGGYYLIDAGYTDNKDAMIYRHNLAE